MRTAITLHRLHGSEIFTTVYGPEVPIEEQKRAIKLLAADGRKHPEIAEAQLWRSDNGLVKRMRFDLPLPAPAPAQAEAGQGSADAQTPAPAETPQLPRRGPRGRRRNLTR